MLSKLQQEFYALVVAGVQEDGLVTEIMDSPEKLAAYYADLRKDISTMDAVDLRKNIKLWKELA